MTTVFHLALLLVDVVDQHDWLRTVLAAPCAAIRASTELPRGCRAVRMPHNLCLGVPVHRAPGVVVSGWPSTGVLAEGQLATVAAEICDRLRSGSARNAYGA